MRTSNEIGDAFEDRVQAVLGGERVRQSGGGNFFKLDVTDSARIVWSCKATASGKRVVTPFFKLTAELIREAKRAARGVLGSGDNYKWAIAAEIEGEAVVIMGLEDYAELMKKAANGEGYIQPSKADERRARARRSLLG